MHAQDLEDELESLNAMLTHVQTKIVSALGKASGEKKPDAEPPAPKDDDGDHEFRGFQDDDEAQDDAPDLDEKASEYFQGKPRNDRPGLVVALDSLEDEPAKKSPPPRPTFKRGK